MKAEVDKKLKELNEYNVIYIKLTYEGKGSSSFCEEFNSFKKFSMHNFDRAINRLYF